MGHDYAIDQAHTVRPPRIGQIASLNVNATSSVIDLSALALNGVQAIDQSKRNHFFLTLEADGNDLYYAFDVKGSTATILDTAAAAAGGPLVLDAGANPANAQCARLIAGLPVDVYIDRQVDGVIIVKCAAGKTAQLRIWASSQNSPAI